MTFWKAEVAQAASASAILALWKTLKCKLNSNWTRKAVITWILNSNMNNSQRGGTARRSFLKPFFHIRAENVFQSFCTKFLSLHHMISLAYKISQRLSANHNPELRCVTCTGVTLELHCSQPIRIEQFFYVHYYSDNLTLLFFHYFLTFPF